MPQTHVLVLGAPRSGTTLLTTMIGCHDEAAMMNEELGYAVHHLVGKRVVGNKLCTPNHIEMTRKRPRWTKLLGSRFFHLLNQYGYFRYRPTALVSIEDYLREESTKVIGIVRDGHAVISSVMERGGQPRKLAVYRWCRAIEILFELRQKHADRLHLLSFEQLVTAPEEAMRAVATYLDLAYQPKMLEGHAHTPNSHYQHQSIDASRAKQPEANDGLDFSLKSHHPKVYRKYENLLQYCKRNGKGAQVSSLPSGSP